MKTYDELVAKCKELLEKGWTETAVCECFAKNSGWATDSIQSAIREERQKQNSTNTTEGGLDMKFGIYLDGELIVERENIYEAYGGAINVTKALGIPHEVRIISENTDEMSANTGGDNLPVKFGIYLKGELIGERDDIFEAYKEAVYVTTMLDVPHEVKMKYGEKE
ncbi:hypothetical protein [Bacillus thuringiensis]|uniref:hypothetical protein n=1 Tax=Bacillus thuringiensis TaxID=1428 RepID=UPI001145B830|nr:hypothetical protein [Bacillus thuringiensis]